MLKLYYAHDNASLIIRLVLEDWGVPYEPALIDRGAGEQHGEAYRALNPQGLIPTLITEHGPMSETAAILLWLADREGKGAPAPRAPERPQFLRWLFFLSNAIHPDMIRLFYTHRYVDRGDSTGLEAQRRLTRARLLKHVGLFADALTGRGDWRGGADVPVTDWYVCAFLRWLAIYPDDRNDWFDLSEWPVLHHLAATLERRPAALAVAEAEGLGPTIFTAPRRATPLVGSAT